MSVLDKVSKMADIFSYLQERCRQLAAIDGVDSDVVAMAANSPLAFASSKAKASLKEASAMAKEWEHASAAAEARIEARKKKEAEEEESYF